jgi:electron transfer flavoprotein beta subunit
MVERVVSDGTEEVEAPLPALVTVSSELGELRYPGVKEIMAAQKTPITVRNAQELGVEVSHLKKPNLVSLSAPPGRKAVCQLIEAETPEEAGADLALKMREAQLL